MSLASSKRFYSKDSSYSSLAEKQSCRDHFLYALILFWILSIFSCLSSVPLDGLYISYISFGSIMSKLTAGFPVFIIFMLTILLIGLIINVLLPLYIIASLSQATLCAVFISLTHGLDLKGWIFILVFVGYRTMVSWMWDSFYQDSTFHVLFIHVTAACGVVWSLCALLLYWASQAENTYTRKLVLADRPQVAISKLTENSAFLHFEPVSFNSNVVYQLELNGEIVPFSGPIKNTAALSQLTPNNLYQVRVLTFLEGNSSSIVGSLYFQTPESNENEDNILDISSCPNPCGETKNELNAEEQEEKLDYIRTKREDIEYHISKFEYMVQQSEEVMNEEVTLLKNQKRQLIMDSSRTRNQLKQLESQKKSLLDSEEELRLVLNKTKDEVASLCSELSSQKDKLEELSQQKDPLVDIENPRKGIMGAQKEAELKSEINQFKEQLKQITEELDIETVLWKEAKSAFVNRQEEFRETHSTDQSIKRNQSALLAEKAALEARHAESCAIYIQLKCEVEALESELHRVTRSKMTLLEEIARRRRELVETYDPEQHQRPQLQGSFSFSSIDSSYLSREANEHFSPEDGSGATGGAKPSNFLKSISSPFNVGSMGGSKYFLDSRTSSVYNAFSPNESFFKDFPFRSFSRSDLNIGVRTGLAQSPFQTVNEAAPASRPGSSISRRTTPGTSTPL